MTTFPKKYAADAAPASVLGLVARLVPPMLEGEHPALAALRAQFSKATITSVEMTGVGFFVDFAVPSDIPLAEPQNFAGGDAVIALAGAAAPAGCVLHVRDGRLTTLEGYTFDEAWPEDAEILSVTDVAPISPS
jgi:hypothetical protein